MNNRVGLIGGMGAVASAEAYKRINEFCQHNHNAYLDEHYPDLIIHNIPSRGLSVTGIENKSILLKELVESSKILSSVGASHIGIACNSAHTLYSEIQKSTTSKIINLIEVTSKKVFEKGVKKIGIIGSYSTNQLRLYDKYLENYGITPETLALKTAQKEIDVAIDNVIRGKYGEKEFKALEYYSSILINRGAEAVIIGCTEISLLTKNIKEKSIPIFDSLDILAEELVNTSIPQSSLEVK